MLPQFLLARTATAVPKPSANINSYSLRCLSTASASATTTSPRRRAQTQTQTQKHTLNSFSLSTAMAMSTTNAATITNSFLQPLILNLKRQLHSTAIPSIQITNTNNNNNNNENDNNNSSSDVIKTLHSCDPKARLLVNNDPNTEGEGFVAAASREHLLKVFQEFGPILNITVKCK